MSVMPQEEINKMIVRRLDRLEKEIEQQVMKGKIHVEGPGNAYVKRVEECMVENLRVLEDHVNGSLEQMYHKMRNLEQSILNLFRDKEIVLTDLNGRMGSLEQAFVTAQQRTETNQLSAITSRIQQLQQVIDLQNKTFESKLSRQHHELSLVKESMTALPQHIHTQQDNKLSTLKQQLQLQLEQVQNTQQEEELMNKVKVLEMERKEHYRNIVQLKRKQEEMEVREQVREEAKDEWKMMDEKVDELRNKIALMEKGSMELRKETKKKTEEVEKKFQEIIQKQTNKLDFERNQQTQVIQEEEITERRGIRGLLQKSKEKQKRSTFETDLTGLIRNNPLPQREDLLGRRALPPVKNILEQRRIPGGRAEWSQSQSQQPAEYNVDEEGFLLDEEGNYLVDEHGEYIQLSKQDLAQLARQQ